MLLTSVRLMEQSGITAEIPFKMFLSVNVCAWLLGFAASFLMISDALSKTEDCETVKRGFRVDWL